VDTAILLALISTTGVLITGAASVVVAAITNRRESKSAAEDAAQKSQEQFLEVKDERLTLRDEQIILLRGQLEECRSRAADLSIRLQRAEAHVQVLEDRLRRKDK
jgi:hypothetical protein